MHSSLQGFGAGSRRIITRSGRLSIRRRRPVNTQSIGTHRWNVGINTCAPRRYLSSGGKRSMHRVKEAGQALFWIVDQ